MKYLEDFSQTNNLGYKEIKKEKEEKEKDYCSCI